MNKTIRRHTMPVISNEVIDYQKDDYPARLEEITGMMKAVMAEYDDDIKGRIRPVFSLLEKLLNDRFGFKVNVQLGLVDGVYALGMLNPNHTFIPSWVRGGVINEVQEKAVRKMIDRKGYVDLRKAKLGGIFTEYTHLLLLNPYASFKKFSNFTKQYAGIITHEVGHVFNFYEYSDRLNSLNRVMMDVATKLRKTNDDTFDTGEYEYLLKDLTEREMATKEDINDILSSDTRTIFTRRVMKKYIGAVNSLLPNDVYDRTTNEQSADAFAARFGYAKEMAEGLSAHGLGNPLPQSVLWMGVGDIIIPGMFLFGLYGFLLGGAASLAAMGAGVVVGAALSFVVAGSQVVGESQRNYTYDDFKVRMLRLKQQNIQILKDVDLDKAGIINLIEGIEVMDKIINDAVIQKPMVTHVKNIFRSVDKKALKAVTEQQMLEALANNDLFTQAARFRSMT